MSDKITEKRQIYVIIEGLFDEVEVLINSGERDLAIDKCLDILVMYKENNLETEPEFTLKDPFYGKYYIFRNIFNIVGALKIMAMAKEIYEARNEVRKVIDVEAYLALIYLDVFDYTNAEEVLHRGLEKAKEINYIPGLVETMNILGRTKYKIGHNQEAHNIMMEAYEISIDHDYNNGKRLSHNMGEIYLRNGEYDKALDYLVAAVKHCKEHKLRTVEGNAYGAMSRAYIGKGDFDLALENIERSFDIAQEMKNNYAKIEIFDTYSKINEGKKDFEAAYHYLREKDNMAETFNLEKGKKQLERININYQLDTDIGGTELLKIKNIELETLSDKLKRTNTALENNILETQRMQSALIDKNEELEGSLVKLEAAQHQLEASEKKEAVARLAFEIADEMVGPLNMAKGSLKHFKSEMENTYIKTLNGELKRSELKHCFDSGFKVLENSSKNLKRIEVYVSRLKMDPNSTIAMEELKVDLAENLEGVLESMHQRLEEEKCSAEIYTKGAVSVRGSNTLISSMFEYMVSSVLNYGFSTPYNNRMEFHITEIRNKVLITYKDTGEIMNSDEIVRALRTDGTREYFDYTNRGYDLAKLNEHVSNFLMGELTCHANPEEGNVIEIKLPKFTKNQEDRQ